MRPSSIKELQEQLKQNPVVLGLVEFGSAQPTSDYDLFVVVGDESEDVKSLHFYAGDTPVDLNIISIHRLASLEKLASFQHNIIHGRIIYDSNHRIEHLLENLRQQVSPPQMPSEHKFSMTRHGHRHVLDKVKGRMDSMPVFCEFLLNTNIYWLIMTYFSVRRIRYEGEKWAFTYLQQNEPEIYAMIELFYDADLVEKYALTEELSDIILAPVGGLWQPTELIAFGTRDTDSDLTEKGHKLFDYLFDYD